MAKMNDRYKHLLLCGINYARKKVFMVQSTGFNLKKNFFRLSEEAKV
jgi:hypothetical protein